MKRLTYPFCLLAILLCLFCCGKTPADTNYENFQKIRKGMHAKKVIEIMGKPDTVINALDGTRRYWYIYSAPFGMSDNLGIHISKRDSIVVGMNDGL